MTHSIAITERTTVKELARLFRDDVWRLHSLPESVVLDRGLQFAVELTKECYGYSDTNNFYFILFYFF